MAEKVTDSLANSLIVW